MLLVYIFSSMRPIRPYYDSDFSFPSAFLHITSPHYQPTERDYDYRPCRYCQHYHRTDAHKCYLLCKYCHSIHFKQDLKNPRLGTSADMCPMMIIQASSVQNKKAYPCEACGGVGVYEKTTSVTYCEPLDIFNARLQ